MQRSPSPAGTPFDVLRAADVPAVSARKPELLERTRVLEAEALDGDPPARVVVCLQDVRFMSERTVEVHGELARRGAQVTVLGRGVRSWVAPGVVGIDLDDDHPLVDQWTFLAVGGAARCLAAQDRSPSEAADDDRDFEVAVTADAELCARVLAVVDGYREPARSSAQPG